MTPIEFQQKLEDLILDFNDEDEAKETMKYFGSMELRNMIKTVYDISSTKE